MVNTGTGQEAAVIGGRVPDDKRGTDDDKDQQKRELFGELKLVRVDGGGLVVLEPFLRELPRNGVGAGLLAPIVG